MNEHIERISDLAKKMRRSAIEMGYAAGKKGAHFGGGLSCIEILACLYGGIMDVDSKQPDKEKRDIFIMSKAHGTLALYTALAHTGFFQTDDLKTFTLNESELSGHPVTNIRRGIEFSGGSLGMGFSQGVGVALGYRRKHIDNHIFVLLGDGECDEGSVWEAAMSAAHFKLDRLIVIVDNNRLQYDGTTAEVMNLISLKEKFSAFGFETYEVDGHDVSELCSALQSAVGDRNQKPKAIIADTVKGKGVSFMENQVGWHHGVLSAKLYQQAISEVG